MDPMPHRFVQCLEQLQFEAAALTAAHPPRFRHDYKKRIYELTCRTPPNGTIRYSRWAPGPLPERLAPHRLQSEVVTDVFNYLGSDSGVWHVNFADPQLFVAYGSALLAQDELQVLEHPALGSLREALLAARLPAVTEEAARPTPVLVTGVERRCALDTAPDLDRPQGLYGGQFAKAPFSSVTSALRILDPPTRTNLIAMAAPVGNGRYSRGLLGGILLTAYTAFTAASQVSRELWPGAAVEVRTGFWGCGAFGGNRTVMVLLQLLAAQLARLDRLTTYVVSQSGVVDYEAGVAALQSLLAANRQEPLLEVLLQQLEHRGYTWGTSDGN
jgi:hypothetical protein